VTALRGIVAVVAFAAYVWVLTRAAPFVITLFAFASDYRPKLYAAFLAVLVGLPGLLWTLPRAFERRRAEVAPTAWSRRDVEAPSRPHLRTDVFGLALLLLAQVPLPAPWGPAGKAATVANITRSPEIVELSATFADYSLPVFAVGVVAAVIAKVYSHAAGWRVIAIILVVSAPVVAWVLALRTI
jgi:hypothetical protein